MGDWPTAGSHDWARESTKGDPFRRLGRHLEFRDDEAAQNPSRDTRWRAREGRECVFDRVETPSHLLFGGGGHPTGLKFHGFVLIRRICVCLNGCISSKTCATSPDVGLGIGKKNIDSGISRCHFHSLFQRTDAELSREGAAVSRFCGDRVILYYVLFSVWGGGGGRKAGMTGAVETLPSQTVGFICRQVCRELGQHPENSHPPHPPSPIQCSY